MAYEFHYTPTGSGAISGQQVLQQTEDAINELGDYVNDNVGGAMDVAQQALTNSANAVDDAQTALNTANNAEGVAIQAQTDVGNLSGTVANIGNRVTTAEGNITNLQGRMTTAEGNITNLQGRMTTAESDIGNLQTAVSTAQATANSAQQTATTARQQSYVFRYSSTALVASSTNSNTLLDNTDNLKVGDKVIDSDGVLFSITAIDTANSTFTVGLALIDLALDANVVHTSGNETVGGVKTFSNNTYITSLNFTNEVPSPSSSSSSILPIITTITYGDSSPSVQARLNLRITADGVKSLYPHENNQYALGLTSRKWSEVHAMTYYYGSSDTEFSDKFVTTDTAQSSISGTKVWIGRQDWGVNCCRIVSGAFEKGEVPTTSSARNDYYIVKNGNTTYADSLGIIGCTVGSDNVVSMAMRAMKNTAGSTLRASLLVRYDTNTDNKILETNGDFLPTANASQNIGNSTSKWATINGLEPSSLGMPDLSNGIDISSYITVNGGNKESLYTPPANGWISIALTRAGGTNMAVMLKQGNFASSGHNIAQENGTTTCNAMLPVKGGVQVSINSALADGIDFAYFYPCQGNV